MQSHCGGGMSPVLRLPSEMLLRIADCLTTVELGYLRRTCKSVEQTIFDSFAKEFFSKRQFMLEEHSLQALVDIASHTSLSKYLKYVIISAERLSNPMQRRIQAQAGGVDTDTLLWTGRARDMLVEAFQNLPNLQTVGVRAQSGPNRTRDGPDSRWRSYGWSFGVEEMIPDFALEHRNQPGLVHNGKESTTFALVVDALAEARVNPEGIEVFIHPGRGLDQTAFSVLGGRSEPRVREVVGKLKRLFLTVGSTPDVQVLTPVKRFLLAAVGVEALRLNMVNGSNDGDTLLKWLSSPPDRATTPQTEPPSSEVSSSVTAAQERPSAGQGLGYIYGSPFSAAFPAAPSLTSPPFAHLRKLDIGFANITHGVLLRLLTRLKLHEISLWKITIVNERQTVSPEEAQQVWPNFLRDLRKSDQPFLRNIFIGEVVAGPVETDPSGLRLFVGVRWLPANHSTNPETPSLKQIGYRAGPGRTAKEWLVEAIDRIERADQPKVYMTGHGRWDDASRFDASFHEAQEDSDDMSMDDDDNSDEEDEEPDDSGHEPDLDLD